MTREARTLFVGTLTLLVYSISIYVSQGSFIFPFPLNEFIFLAIAVQFFLWNRNGNKLAGILVTLAGVCAVLSTQFFWTFFYGQEGMIHLMEGMTTDYFLIGYYILVLIAGVATLIRQKRGISMLFNSFFVLAFISGIMYNHTLLLVLAYGFMVASTQISKVFASYHLLWILLFILELTKWLSFFLNS
ncbi:hypothetical protein N9F08_00645 [bacterium]|nr:hypothetical protein [bacterium]